MPPRAKKAEKKVEESKDMDIDSEPVAGKHNHESTTQKEKDSFQPLTEEYYEGKHLSEPVKEIKVCCLYFFFLKENSAIGCFLTIINALILIYLFYIIRINGNYYQHFSKSKVSSNNILIHTTILLMSIYAKLSRPMKKLLRTLIPTFT